MLQRYASCLDNKAVAWAVLGLTILLTLWLWRYSESELSHRQHERFLLAVKNHQSRLIGRMQDYEQVLRAGVALFAAKGMPSREEWRIYVEALQLDSTLPGILGTGFALMVPRSDKAAHEQSVRAEGYPAYRIHPADNREMLSSIVYLEPFKGRNLRAFGFDMYSDPVRRAAMARARDTGRPAISGKVRLVQETNAEVQPGFLMYLPVYREDLPHHSVATRRRALVGFVYSPFRAFDLLENVFHDVDQELEVQLFDRRPVPENLFFSTPGAVRTAQHSIEREFEVGGQVWVARFWSSRNLEASLASSQSTLILFGGLALDLLLFSVLYLNAKFRRKMRNAAAKLQLSLDSFTTLMENIPGAVFRSEIGTSLRMVQLSQGVQTLTAVPPERFLTGELAYRELIHPDDKCNVSEAIAEAIATQSAYAIEYRIRAMDGFTRWVGERGRATAGTGIQGGWLDGVILDITERKAAEIMIRDLAFNDTLTGLPNRRLLLDRLDHQLLSSTRTGQYGALMFIDLDDFKAINDTLGHQAGDQVLIEVSSRLLASVRESDTVARLSGDEFVVVLDNLGKTAEAAIAEATAMGSKIRDRLSQPYTLGTAPGHTTPSIGITVFCGAGASAHQLLRRADQAMYKAKSAGRNQLQFYEGDAGPEKA